MALAQLGFSVYAFDQDRKLLDELKRNSAILIPLRWSKTCLQWFSDPDRAIEAIFHSLKKSGKLGLACPATSDWSPWFGRIISKIAENKEIKPVFSHWKNPWFHLPTENDYRLLFEKHGQKGKTLMVRFVL